MATSAPNNLLDIIQEDSTQLLVQSSQAEQDTKDNLIKQQEVTANQVRLAEQGAKDKALVQLTADTAALRAQQLMQGALSKAGLDPNKVAERITSIVSEVVTTGEKRMDAAKKYEESKKGSIIELGPIDWFKRRYEGGEARIDMEHAENRQRIALTSLESLNKTISESSRLAAGTTESITAASVEANSRLAATQFQGEAYKAQLEGLKYGGQLSQVAINSTKERLQTLYNLNSAEKGEKTFQLQLKAFDQNVEEFDWRKEQKKILDEKKADDKDLDSYALERINVGRGNRGLPPLEGRDAKIQLNLFKAGGEGSKEMNADYRRGEATIITGIPVLGSSPAETAELLEKNRTALPEHRQKLAEVLITAHRDVEANGALYPKPEDKARAVNKIVTDHIAAQWGSIKANTGNVFDIGSLTSYIELSGVKDLPLISKVLLPAKTANQDLSNPSIVAALTANAIYNKTITTSEGADLSRIYQIGNEVHQAASGFKAAGISVPKDGKAYNANLGFGRKINLTNQQEVARYLNSILAEKAYGIRQQAMGIDPRGSAVSPLQYRDGTP